MQFFNIGNHKIWRQSLLACVLMATILFSFYNFSEDNHQRIIEQNEVYLEDVTRQTAERVDDILKLRQYSLNILGVTVESTIQEPKISQELLQTLEKKSAFDYIEFVDSAGKNLRSDGKTSDSSDRENYLEGMKGKEGVTLIFNYRITHEILINYYIPISFEGRIIGFLNGMYREEQLWETISTDFFGMPAKTYLCKKDGTVISSSGTGQDPDNLLDFLTNTPEVSPTDQINIRKAFENHQSYGYTYQDTSGPGNAYLTALSDNGWMLMQAFPSSLTAAMLDNANSSGVNLESQLVILFLLYMLYLVWENSLQKRTADC